MNTIKIPSVRVYDKENDKYIDNVIVSIDYSYPEIKTTIEQEQDSAFVYEEKNQQSAYQLYSSGNYVDGIIQGGYDQAGSYTWNPSTGYGILQLDNNAKYSVLLLPITISFPRAQDNNKKYMLKINLGSDSSTNMPFTTYSSYGLKTTGTKTIRLSVTPDTYFGDTGAYNIDSSEVSADYYLNNIQNFYSFDGTTETETLDETIGTTEEKSYDVQGTTNWNGIITDISVVINDENFGSCLSSNSNSNISWSIDSNDNIVITGLKIPISYVRFFPLSQISSMRQEGNELDYYDQNGELYQDYSSIDTKSKSPAKVAGNFPYEKTVFEAESFIVSIRGDYREVVEEDVNGTIMLNEEGDITHSYSGNSLSSYKNTINGDPLPIHTVKTIISDWQYGKEIATIRVSINDYYDTDGNLAVSISDDSVPMLFKNGDTVIPYVATPNGDRPMSSKPDGTPKEFLVTGVTLISDGAVWQELQLQEVSG